MRIGKFIFPILTVLIASSLVFPWFSNPSGWRTQAATAVTVESAHSLVIESQEQNQTDTLKTNIILLSANQQRIELQATFDPSQLQLALLNLDGKAFTQVNVPGWPVLSKPGQPSLPFLVEQIGIPFGVSLEISTFPGKFQRIALDAPVVPAAGQNLVWSQPVETENGLSSPIIGREVIEDAKIYDQNTRFPDLLAQITNEGVIRQQRVAGLSIYPIQYKPDTQELLVYESIVIELQFAGSPAYSDRDTRKESPFYERLFQHELINYQSALGWRQPRQLLPKSELVVDGTSTDHLEETPWQPPAPGWRIKVKEDGLYKISYSEMEDAGLPVASLDPTTLQMFYLGNEIAIQVVGEADHHFNPEDVLIFYGESIQSKYTAENVYWLTYGAAPGQRIALRDGTPGSASTPDNYPATLHFETNQFYLPFTPGADNLDRWMWDYLYPPGRPSWTHTFSLTDPYTGPASITVALLGYLQNPINPDHHVRIFVNGTQVGDLWWDGVTWQTIEMPIPAGVLQAGSNTIQAIAPNDTGLGYDVVYIDWAELDFPNNTTADGNLLAFRYDTVGDWKFQVDGFNSDVITVYGVTDPYVVYQLDNVTVITSTLGYLAEFQDQVLGSNAYWAQTNTTFQTVHEIKADTESNLRSTFNSADILLITHQDFWQEVTALRDHRATQMDAMQVDIQDIYDEFGYGIVDVQAIYDFLKFTHNSWQPSAPAYVVLVGDGHYDPKDYKGYGRESYIPPYLTRSDPWIGETATDNRYVTLSGSDVFPDMMLGRLSVNDANEADSFINKIIAYEQNPVAGDWSQQIMAVADNTDDAGNFTQYSDDLLTCCFGSPYQAEKIYYGVTHSTPAAAQSAIKAGINAGKLLVNYIGHAYSTAWAEENLLTTQDVPLLANGGKQPVVLAMTCREGYYHSPDPIANQQEALAEVITRADSKGAIASWSPTGLGISTGHDALDRGFFEAVFLNGDPGLGNATQAGLLKLWATGSDLDLVDTYLLFGDPALTLQAPWTALPAPTNLQATPISGTEIDLTWQDNTQDESEFQIERSLDGLTGWEQVGVTPSGITNFTDTGLSCATSNTYRVRAYRSGDNTASDYSNLATTTTYTCPIVAFVPGWNLISLPVFPAGSLDSDTILQAINAQGGACQELMEWRDSGWNSHELNQPFGLFSIEMGKGYFARCDQSSSWTLNGSPVENGITIDLVPGWNLVGIPFPASGYQAHDILDEISNQGGACSEIMRWQNSGWESYIPNIPVNDFDILPQFGYFVLCSTSSSYTPASIPH